MNWTAIGAWLVSYSLRRTLLAITLSVSWIPVLCLLARIVWLLRASPAALTQIALCLIALLFVVFACLGMAVSLKQLSAKFAGMDFNMGGGSDGGAQPE